MPYLHEFFQLFVLYDCVYDQEAPIQPLVTTALSGSKLEHKKHRPSYMKMFFNI